MKAIPSASICNFFYFFFVLYAVILTLSVLGFAGIVLSPKLSKALSVPNSLGLAIAVLLAGTQMLYFDLLCSRSLFEVKQTKEGFVVIDAKDPKEKIANADGDTFADLMDCSKPENKANPQCAKH